MNLDHILLATDSARVQSGGRSIYEKVADAMTAGTAGAVVSAYGSLYNTGVTLTNAVFGTDIDELNTADVLRNVDSNWGKYYEENKQVIDTVGFIGGSFLPGGLALKGFNLARAGKPAGVFRAALGFTRNAQESYLRKGLEELASEGTNVFTLINKNKLASMLYGAADNVLQTAVFETAAAITMQRSPVLADESWGDIAWDITKTSLAGGLLGGGIEALWTNKIFRDAGKLVERTGRKYDTIAALEKMGLNFGDESFSMMDSVLNLPKEVFESDKALKFSYRINGKNIVQSLDTSGLYDKKLRDTVDKGFELFTGKLTNAVATDATVGAPFAAALLDIVHQGKKANKAASAIKEELGTYLFNLKQIQSVGLDEVIDFSKETVYLKPGISLAKTDKLDPRFPFSSRRVGSTDNAYRFVKDPSEAKTGILGTGGVPLKVPDAWELGYDMVFSGKNGRIHINPKSPVIQSISDAEDSIVRVAFNTRTRQTADSIVPSIADVATGKSPLLPSANVIQSGKYSFLFSPENFDNGIDSIRDSARNLWASGVKNLKSKTISGDDFALLDRILEDPGIVDAATKIKISDDLIWQVADIQDMRSFVLKRKLDYFMRTQSELGADLDPRALAYKLNVEQPWVQKALEFEFDAAKLDVTDAFRPLNSYAARDNIVMVYDKVALDGANDFPTGLLAYNYRKKAAVEKSHELAAAVLGKHFDRFMNMDPGKLTGQIDATGVGATGAGFSNADYDDLARVWAQDRGRAVHLTKQDFRNAALTPLAPVAANVVANNNKQLGAVLTRIRLTEEPVSLLGNKIVDYEYLQEYRKVQNAVATGKATPADLAKITPKVSIDLTDDVAAFLGTYHEGHKTWLGNQRMLASAQGKTLDWQDDILYLPPVDTKNVPYFAFVRAREGHIFGTSEVAMLTAKSPDELQRLAGIVEKEHPGLKVIFKKDTEDYFKAKGQFDFSSGLNSPYIDPLLRKQGKMGDFQPVLEPRAVVEEFVQYIGKREDNLVRNAVQVLDGQTFAELQYLSDRFTRIEKSKFGFVGKVEQTKITDPFGDYMRTALDISKRAEFTLWHQANEFVDALGTRAYSAVENSFKSAKEGKTDWQEANKVLEQVGLGPFFKSQEAYLLAQSGADRSLVSQAVAKGNMLLANIALRLDTANAMINIISAPILMGTEVSAIRHSLRKNPELFAKFESQLAVALPGEKLAVPSTLKLLYSGVRNFFGPEKAALISRYKNTIGSIRGDLHQYHSMVDDMALTPNLVPKKWAESVNKAMEKGATWTGNNFAEDFTRFVASDVMRQITQPLVEAGKMGIKEQNSMIAIFVNRVQGNYIASQRPIMFQGVIGAAIGLFQTYQFNLFQQVFRHIEDKNLRTLAVAAGLQSAIFGLNGLPFFDAINTHLIGNANINEGHRDVYSMMASGVPKEWADWAMYGTASSFPLFSDKAPALFTRGDLNPRHLTIVPTSFTSIPVVEATTRLAKAVWGMGNQVANGGDFGQAMLHGLEHNGISRPLAGLAQAIQGSRTTSSGTMIAANSDFMSIATATRMIGARPVDEAIALNHKYRLTAYKASDRDRIERLGAVVKAKIRSGGLTEDDILDFASRYAAAGGRVENYGAALQRWTKTATQSDLNTIMRAQKTSYGQRMMEVMGADPLPDWMDPEE